MKNLKLTLIIAMIAVVSAVSAQVDFGVKGGINMSNFSGLDNNKAKIGFNIGVSADYDFAPNMGIQSGLFVTTKGYKHKGDVSEYSDNLVYLQLPVHFVYKIDVTPGTRVFLHGGPYAAYGVGGSRTIKLGSLEGSSKKVFGSSGKYDAFDAGLGIGAGVELGRLFFDLGWDFGLIDIAKVGDVKNQNSYLSVGYKF